VSEGRIARVYAEALFEAASEEGKIEAVRRDLGAFAAAVEVSGDLYALLTDSNVSPDDKRQVLLTLTEGGEPLVQNFLRLLVDKQREGILAEVEDLFVEMVEAAEGILRVELVTARPVSDDVKAEIERSLEASLEKAVELSLMVDESILGGVRLRIGDKIADASLRHRLDQLRARLASPVATLEGSVETAS
jgi:F-type H+-transporting ATPase subunit delta